MRWKLVALLIFIAVHLILFTPTCLIGNERPDIKLSDQMAGITQAAEWTMIYLSMPGPEPIIIHYCFGQGISIAAWASHFADEAVCRSIHIRALGPPGTVETDRFGLVQHIISQSPGVYRDPFSDSTYEKEIRIMGHIFQRNYASQ